ncbi:hypothetical protein GOBAR_DD01191 [Gossypium barbadense]|nr:hypothetical protein GOBAR_DD01191 [Gossypium barbadense]
MARLPLIAQSVRRKRIGLALTIRLEICRIAIWFLLRMGASLSLQTYRPRIRSYTLDFYAKRDYVKRLIYAGDKTWGLKSSRFMLVDEQVAMFLHIISHHLKNRVIKHHFRMSGETISRAFHSVLNAVIRLQDVLFKKPEPITTDSSDTRWKWFKNCLGALDGTHIKIRVPTVDKPRYRTRKGDIATNMLGVCTPEMQFVYVLLGWEGSVADGRIIMSGVPQSHASSQASRGSKRKWIPEEDAALVSCMVDLHNVGTFNADTGCLKREWSVVYDMLNGQNNSGFGWDEHRQLVVAEDAVWESYVKLTAIYARDRATGKDAQTATDILEEIHAEDERTTDMNEERNTFYDCEADVSLDDMDVSGTDPRGDRDQGGSSSSNKRKKKSDARDNVYSSFDEAATLLGEKIQAVGDQINRSIASEVVVQRKSEEHQKMEEKASNLYSALWSIEGLTDNQRYDALSKIPDHPTQMIVFFSLPSVARLE